MCKSQAEGGRRCKFHLEQGVSGGMCTFAASVTGLTPKETAEAFTALEREGRNAPDPTREEVDDFLDKQIFRVRHEPDLTDKRRESILSRLRAAIGRITPNGATFHAMKNLVAESWSRVRRKAAAAFILGALTFSVGACGNVPDEAIDRGKVEQVSGAPANAGSGASGYDVTFADAKPQIKEEAVDRFGRQAAVAATEFAVEYTEDVGYDEEAIRAHRPDGIAHVLAFGEGMTQQAKSDWTANVNAYAQEREDGLTDAASVVTSLTFYDALRDSSYEDKPLDFNREGPTVVNPRTTSVVTSVTADDRIHVEVKTAADIRVVHDGVGKVAKATRSVDYFLMKTKAGWKVDGWLGTFTFGVDKMKVEK